MTVTMLIASSFLAGSLLTLLVPVATFIAVATWLTLVVRRSGARSGPTAGAGGGRA